MQHLKSSLLQLRDDSKHSMNIITNATRGNIKSKILLIKDTIHTVIKFFFINMTNSFNVKVQEWKK